MVFLHTISKKITKCSLGNEKKGIQCSRKLYKLLLQENQCLIMDNKTYIKKDFAQVPRQQFCYKFEGKDVENKFKYIQTEKFAPKYLIWQAFCSCVLHCPPFVKQQTLTADIYIKECLKKRLVPFIKSHNILTLFWPDLALIHYSKKTM